MKNARVISSALDVGLLVVNGVLTVTELKSLKLSEVRKIWADWLTMRTRK